MISEIFIERPKLAMVISIVIMIGGILCITKVPVAEYPEVTPPQINVSATYPGASAQVIADTVAAPIETEVNGVENMIYFSSQSDNSGNYSLDLTFEPGTDQDIAMVNVQNAVNRAEPVLPEEVVALGLKVRKRSGDMLGVFVFIAIPLPMTGVWTGTAIAVFLGLKFRQVILPVLGGNLVAGLIISEFVGLRKIRALDSRSGRS